MTRIAERGAGIANVVLHVGVGTFRPVEVDDPSHHEMHQEYYELPAATAEAIQATREGGGRVWAVGTTTVRVLETVAADQGFGTGDKGVNIGEAPALRAAEGWTDLFLRPPHTFRIVDGLLTNFHLPRSTLMMLVAAFLGYEATMAAYREAVRERYRFYSYGDAMAIL